ncbi:MAG TPA: glycosyltransferase [Ktedonobacterales bacterium]|nr:glycosyltransferase [Ktedonobacterales bacterium]
MCFRVAMISLHTSPLAPIGRTRNAGGMNVYVRELSRELGQGSMYVDIFTRRSDPALPMVQWINERVRLIHIPAGPPTLLPPTELYPYVDEFARRVARFAERGEHGYDLIHSHYWLSATAGTILANEWDVPHVTMFHTVERLKGQQYGDPTAPITRAGAVRIEQEGCIAKAVDCVTVSTEQEGEQLRKLYGLPSSAIRVIPCGVDLRAFTPNSPAQQRAARQELSPDGLPVLLFVGRLDPIKGLDLLLESVASMRTRARLFIVGGNPEGDAEVDRLRSVAAALGIADRVVCPGAVPQPELVRYYRAADALVVTSRYESFGLAAVEALACGTPVVASAVGGLTSIVRDGENGLLVCWRRPDAFAERLDELLTDDALRARLAARARPSVERFSWRRIGDEVRGIYQELTAEQRVAVAACCCF